MQPPHHRRRLAVFASGSGSTFDALVDAAFAGRVHAEVVLLVVSRRDAPAIDRAARRAVPVLTVDQRSMSSDAADETILQTLLAARVDVVLLAGYLRKIGPRTLEAYRGRILNTHPAPLPEFGGPGMYGEHVHRAVLESGAAMSAATVHLVDQEYDTGPVVASSPVPVRDGDDIPSLRARVQRAEKDLIIRVLNEFVVPPRQRIR